jgi:hypothetical protein
MTPYYEQAGITIYHGSPANNHHGAEGVMGKFQVHQIDGNQREIKAVPRCPTRRCVDR